MSIASRCQFICGEDEFIVHHKAQEIWTEWTADIEDSFAFEVVKAAAGNTTEAEEIMTRAIAAIQTMPMFGNEKFVWIQGLNLLGDTRVGKSQGTQGLIEKLQDVIQRTEDVGVSILISATPVDRRKKLFKWFQANCDLLFVGGKNSSETNIKLLLDEAAQEKLRLTPDMATLLLDRVDHNPRMALEELRKLSIWLGSEDRGVTREHILDLVPAFGEGDFFEAAEAFFKPDLAWTLDAIHRHFFMGHDIRPLLVTMQNKCRLLIQLKALQQGKRLGRSFRKTDLERLASQYEDVFSRAGKKSSFNVFTQHPFYLSRLADSLPSFSLKRLLLIQRSFVDAFEETIKDPSSAERTMANIAICCLASAI